MSDENNKILAILDMIEARLNKNVKQLDADGVYTVILNMTGSEEIAKRVGSLLVQFNETYRLIEDLNYSKNEIECKSKRLADYIDKLDDGIGWGNQPKASEKI